jgi:Domain of unknown function (DUF5666)
MKDLHIAAGVLTALALTTSCSDRTVPASPTGPTPILAQLSSARGGADSVTAAEVDRIGGRADEATVRTWANGSGWSTTNDGLEVEGTDVITSVTGVCPNVVLTVRGVPVTLNAATVFDSTAPCAVLAPGQRVHVRGTLTFTAAGLAVLATRIQLEDAGPRIEIGGVVASVSGACPALVITLQGIPGSIVTNAATEFTPRAACSGITPGMEIEVEGTLTAPEQLTATELEIDDDDDEVPSGRQMTICHIPPGNYSARHTITIDASAWPAHAGHCAQGTCDYAGSCR